MHASVTCQGEGEAGAKALGWEGPWCLRATDRRPLWFELGDQGRVGEMSWERPAEARSCRALKISEQTVDFSLRIVSPWSIVHSGGTGLVAF